MSGRDRKARKRSGEKFQRTAKVATPVLDRLEFRHASPKHQRAELAARGIELTPGQKLMLKIGKRKPLIQAKNYSR